MDDLRYTKLNSFPLRGSGHFGLFWLVPRTRAVTRFARTRPYRRGARWFEPLLTDLNKIGYDRPGLAAPMDKSQWRNQRRRIQYWTIGDALLPNFPNRRRDQRNADAGGNQIDADQHLLHLGNDERFEAGLGAGLNDVGVHARSGMAAYQDQSLARERA